MNRMNEYGKRPGNGSVDPFIIFPPPFPPPYPPPCSNCPPPRPYPPRPYPPAPWIGPWGPVGRPCNGPGCRHDDHDHHHPHDFDRPRRGPWD